MGPSIIFDKSAIQSFSENEILILTKYFYLNVTPVLINEIIGDLSKDSNDEAMNRKKVIFLANKLSPTSSAVNSHYTSLIYHELNGGRIPMNSFRPMVKANNEFRDKDGKKGVLIVQSEFEFAIEKWKTGRFSVEDEIFSKLWRQNLKKIDLEKFKDIFKGFKNLVPKAKDLKELSNKVDNILERKYNQAKILELALNMLGIDRMSKTMIVSRWHKYFRQDILNYAPYTFYCFRLLLIFSLAILNNLIGVRPTNLIDLEYLFYLPFCRIFTSDDKVHRNLVPYLLHSEQDFIEGKSLKSALSRISAEWNNLPDSDRIEIWEKKYGFNTPFKDSVIQKFLDKLYNSDMKGPKIDELDPNLKDVDMIIHKKRISIYALCPCGSGKKFKDCHYEEYLDKNK